MAKQKRVKSKITKSSPSRSSKVIVQELNITSADRSYKDVGEFKKALQSAESVYYPNRTRLYDLYAHVIIDPHVSGVIDKRVDSILNKKLNYENAAGKRMEEMESVIESNTFRKVIRQIILSKMYGIKGLEFIPGPELDFKSIPIKHIKPEKKVIAKEQYDDTGIPYEQLSNVWVIGDDDDLGLLLKCSLYALWKMGVMADYAQYIEIFGQPVRVVYYDAYDNKTRTELRKVLDEAGSSLALMIPQQAKFEMKDGKQSNGDGKLQATFLKYCDDEISIAILGNTESTSSSSSSGYAQSKEHGKQQLEITKSDMKFVANLLNSEKFRVILRSYGLGIEGGRFVYEKEIDLTELERRQKIDLNVAKMVPVGDDYWYETYGVPKPENYDELKKKQEEERMLKLQPPTPPSSSGEGPGVRPKKTEKKKPKLGAPSHQGEGWGDGFWQRLRTNLADFFDPAP